MAYDLGVVGDVAAGPNRAGKPGIGPGARIGDGVGRTVEIILVLVIHVGPKRVAHAERTRLPLERRGVVLILGILNVDLGIGGQLVSRGDCGGIGLSRSGNRSGRDGRRLLGSSVGFGRGLLCRLLIGHRLLLGVGRGVVGCRRVLGRLILGSGLDLRRRRELIDSLGDALGAFGPQLCRRGAKDHKHGHKRHEDTCGGYSHVPDCARHSIAHSLAR